MRLYPTQPVHETGLEAESGFIITPGTPPHEVRFDGRTVAWFGTSMEAREYVKRKGYDVRKGENGSVVTLLGVDVDRFRDASSAWAWITGQMRVS